MFFSAKSKFPKFLEFTKKGFFQVWWPDIFTQCSQRVMCHMSCVIFFLQIFGARRWRVCYQRGLPCFFFLFKKDKLVHYVFMFPNRLNIPFIFSLFCSLCSLIPPSVVMGSIQREDCSDQWDSTDVDQFSFEQWCCSNTRKSLHNFV